MFPRFASTLAFALVLSMPSLAFAERVEITLVDELDGDLSGYCLDIAGGQQDAKPENGLQAHTCYSYKGDLGVDQVFETDRFADAVLYMPEFDVCATLDDMTAGASVGLAACDGSAAQAIELTGGGKLCPTGAAELCLTAGEETRLGRGGTSRHQIKTLTLETCADDRAAYQTWRVRSSAD